ncbi:STE like transcription factor-domain-containing protein, partial [Circinella umbellata]
MINQLKYFLATAPTEWDVPQDEPPIKKHILPLGDTISCVQWNTSYYISGTDIVRCLVFRFHAFGRPIQNLKKFEEGIFSDLRNLKPGTDATLEEPKSQFLDLLYKHNCIRTQKKQKVFNWFSVPHDRLFLDALERDLKREKLGVDPTSLAVANPAVSISLDTTQA